MPSQLSRVATSAIVQSYAKGSAQSALDRMEIANFLAPRVPVPGIKFDYWTYDSRSPYKIMNTKRALHGGAAVLETGGTKVSSELVANAIDAPIDEAEKMAEDTLQLTLMERADEAAQAAALSHEYEVIQAALTAAGAGTDYSAAQNSSNDLKLLMDTAILAVIKNAKCGSNMNVRALFGANAALRFLNHNTIRGLYKGGAKTTATPTMDEVSGLLMGKPQVKQALTVYDSSVEGLAESMNWVLDSSVLIFVSSDAPVRRSPDFMKTFCMGGQIMKTGTYMRQDGRVEVAKNDWYTKPTVTNTSAVIRLNFNAA